VAQYRGFRNTDPPRLVEVWNEAFTGRGSIRLRNSSPLEQYVFAKPYFDPAGLILAEEDGACVGFVHAGFGANETGTAPAPACGVTCILGVRPSHRRRGIGSELLHRSEAYLRDRGAQALYAGPIRPRDPFYLGLYGGSDVPGYLTSDTAAEPFFTRHGYRPYQKCLVFQRRLDKPVNVVDGRFPVVRNRYDLQLGPRKEVGSWWQEASLGLIEPFDFVLAEKLTGRVAAQASVWEMEGFSWRWNQPSCGLSEISVRSDLLRQGLAKFLLTSVVRYLQEQFFGLVEIHVREENEPALGWSAASASNPSIPGWPTSSLSKSEISNPKSETNSHPETPITEVLRFEIYDLGFQL
jgi:ribosomal protein S18 acetylase RimI-like enzyme